MNVLNKIITPAVCIVPRVKTVDFPNIVSRMYCQPELSESHARKHD